MSMPSRPSVHNKHNDNRSIKANDRGRSKMSFGQLTVRAKLALTFGMMAALVVLVSVIALSALGDANDSFASYVDGARARAALTEKIRAAVLQRAVAVRNLVLVKKPADVEAERVAMTQAHDEVQARLRQLNEAIATNPDVTAKARVLVAEINPLVRTLPPVTLPVALTRPPVLTFPLLTFPVVLRLVPVAAPIVGVVKLADALTMILPATSNAVVSLSTLALNCVPIKLRPALVLAV